MSEVLIVLAAATLAGVWAHRAYRARRTREGPLPEDDATAPAAADVERTDPTSLAEPLGDLLDGASHPRDLLASAEFVRAAQVLADGDASSETLISYASGRTPIVWCLATEALVRRAAREDLTQALLQMLHGYGWRSYFVLRALHAGATMPLAGLVLAQLDSDWADEPQRGWLIEFLNLRAEAGELPTLAPAAGALDALSAERRAEVDSLVHALAGVLPVQLVSEYRQWQKQRTDVAFLRTIGHVHDEQDDEAAAAIIDHAGLRDAVAELAAVVCRDAPRAAVVIGEPGVGKSAVIAKLAAQLRAQGWIVFRCSAAELVAGQGFIGQMEDQVQRVVREIESRRVLWIVPEFHELLYAGRHVQNPAGLLDNIFPHLERGTLRLVGEATPAAYEKVLQQRPRLRRAVETVRIEPLPAAATAELAADWARRGNIAQPVLQEAQQLAAQHLSEFHSPGNVLMLLKQAAAHATARDGAGAAVDRADLLHTLATVTGLPLDVLDDRAVLDLQRLRDFFGARVLGQDEAVNALVERIALIKAGLTDPTRPQGVFLFVGPTGTGKTELAKALADYLFGSPDRMIRLDMSEFQDPSMAHRLLGSGSDLERGSTLVDEVRRQPFSVVLLDEIEKADPRIWDLFLQLFDDGRLTDHSGNTASFRNAIVIMTSNLGADSRITGFGFAAGAGGGSAPAGQRALEQTFRPEFLNRIDRVVWFRPLGRSIMRQLLDKEIRDVLGRRGLRNRAWAIEWEESAMELLIMHGFSPLQGARPLKRAVERYLLSPLAMSIVGRRVPEGEQFLLIGSAGDALTVEFIDPDAPPEGVAPEQGADHDDAEVVLEDLVRDARGSAAEVAALHAEYGHLQEAITAAEWRDRKQRALAEMSQPEFWSSADRFAVMGMAEYMDRIEVGFETAGSLLHRIRRATRGSGGNVPAQLVRRLAQQLYLVGEAMDGVAAKLPRDAFIRISAAQDPGVDTVRADDFARRLDRMYRSWADHRRMRLQVLEERTAEPYTVTLAVSGFAAYPILAGEHGHHLLESPRTGKSFSRLRALVLVAAQPDEPPSAGVTLRMQASTALAAAETRQAAVVRRYRDEPSPLVRDSVRGWRTGRIDHVMDGDFDLLG